MEEISNYNNKPNINLPRFIAKQYLPYWPLFLVLFAFAGAGVWLYLKSAKPVYRADARLLIADEKKGAEESKTLEALNQIAVNKVSENEMQVIQSRVLAREVVYSLALYAPIQQDSSWKDFAAYTTSPISIVAQEPEKITAIKKVAFGYNVQQQYVSIANKNYPLNTWISTQYGVLKFVRNVHLQQTDGDNKRLFFSLSTVKSATDDVLKRITVEGVTKESSILDISITDEVPERARDILNALLAAYITESTKDKKLLAQNTLSFLNTRIAAIEQNLTEIERKTEQYKTQNNATDVSTQGKLYLQNVSNNDQQLGGINMQLAILDQVQSYAQAKTGTDVIAPSVVGINDPVLSQLIAKLYSTQLQYNELVKTTGPNNPITVNAKDETEHLKAGILDNIETQKRSLTASKNDLSATNSSYSSTLQNIPQKERELIDITREQTNKTETYNFLLQKREETALSLSSIDQSAKIIDPAEFTDTPVSPKKKLVYLTAFLAAIITGITAVYMKRMLSDKVTERSEIELNTKYPIIGEITKIYTKQPIVVGQIKNSFSNEQFRRLRVTLSYLGINSVNNKRILVTSSIAGEGKSFIAANLALSLAGTGKKVVLVDFDINNPSLNYTAAEKHKGVTDYLLNGTEVTDIIKQTSLSDNLYVVTAGELPINPTELMMAGKIQEFLDYLDSKFDYIVIDTAPVTPVTDAYILSPFCSATLYVVRQDYTPKIFIERLDDKNKINKLKGIAIVFNSVKPTNIEKYGYGYGYGSAKQARKRRLTV